MTPVQPIVEDRAARWLSAPDTDWLDIALVLVLAIVSLPWAVRHDPAHQGLAVLFTVLLVAPLAIVRRWPMGAFAAIAVIAFVQWLITLPLVADFALLIALFIVALRESRRRVLAAAVVLEFGVLLALVKDDQPNANWVIALVMLSGLVVASAMLGRNVQLHFDQLEQAKQRAARLEFERDQQAEMATAAERTRIARDLHDIVAHNLAVMIALIDGAELSLDRQPEQAHAALRDAGAVGRRAMTDLRQSLGVLRGAGDDPGRAPAPKIADLAPLLNAAADTGLLITTDLAPGLDALPEALQLSVYRIVQESVTNVIKHADSATAIRVEVRRTAGQLIVSIANDGANEGDSISAAGQSGGRPAPATGGHGLRGMRERVAVHGGQLLAGPSGSGWQVTATIPEGVR